LQGIVPFAPDTDPVKRNFDLMLACLGRFDDVDNLRVTRANLDFCTEKSTPYRKRGYG